jgi:hypothetical protein
VVLLTAAEYRWRSVVSGQRSFFFKGVAVLPAGAAGLAILFQAANGNLAKDGVMIHSKTATVEALGG